MTKMKKNAKKEQKNTRWKDMVPLFLFMGVGAVCGVLIGEYIFPAIESGESLGESIFLVAVLFVGMYAAMLIQIILHEAGHLLFGLLTGYRFCSFRVGSFMWKKEKEGLRFCRMSLAGTAGQCLMAPPELKEGRMPYVLYNLGGSLNNLIVAALSGLLWLSVRNVPLLSTFLVMLAVIGVAFALMNGVPMRVGGVDNDGYNGMSLGKNPEAIRAFWIQMKINEELSGGMRLKEMPEEWFAESSENGMENSLIVSLAVFRCNRLMDEMNLEQADQEMEALLNGRNGLPGIYRRMLVIDRIYCELVGENRQERIDEWMTKEQLAFMKSMRNHPSILRTQYAYALLAECDRAKGEEYQAKFDQIAKTYPYPVEIEGERELMEYAHGRICALDREGGQY